MRSRLGALALAVALVAVGCSSGTEPVATRTDQQLRAAGFGCRELVVTADDGTTRTSCIWVADTPALQQRGLMGVDDPDLGGRPAMAFVFDEPTAAGFWMKDTRIPLTAVWIADDGRVTGSVDMDPCLEGSACPITSAPAPSRLAIEVPRGGASALGLVPGARIALGDDC